MKFDWQSFFVRNAESQARIDRKVPHNLNQTIKGCAPLIRRPRTPRGNRKAS